MKTIKLIFTIGLLLGSNLLFANSPTNAEWKETLRLELNKLLGEDFSIESIDVNSSEKQLSGIGTFFKKPNIGFEVAYDSFNKIASFSANFPIDSKIDFNNKEMNNMLSQKLIDFVPNAIGNAVSLKNFGFSVSKENKKIELLQLGFRCLQNWELLQSSNLSLNQMNIDFDIYHPTEKEKRDYKGFLTGFTDIGNLPVKLTAELTKQKEELEFSGAIGDLGLQTSLQSICGTNSIKGISVPSSIINLNLKDATIKSAPYKKWVQIVANSTLGFVDVWVQKNKDSKNKKLDYVVTIAPPENFKLSKLNNKLSPLDVVDLSGQKIVLTSEKKDKKETSKIPSLAQIKSGISKGCNYVAALDVTKLKLEHILKVKTLVVNSPLTSKLDGIVLQAPIETDLEFSETTKLSQVLFKLQPSPNDFQVSLAGILDTKIGSDLLEFKGGVELVINTQTMNFMALMNGDWNKPLGVKGLTMSDVGLQLGASMAGGLPNMALQGEIKIGPQTGKAALAFDSRDPSKSMMSVGFNKLGVMDIMNQIIDPKVTKKLPNAIIKTLEDIYLENLSMEVVPKALEVLDKKYAAGFRMNGAINVMNVKGIAEMDLDYTKGIYVNGSVDPISLAGFKMKGANGKERPSLTIDLQKGNKAKIILNGMVDVMGVQAITDVEVLPNGFKFMLGGKIFNIFNGDITVSAGDLKKAENLYLKVNMENDLLGFIDREATKFIQETTKGAVQKLTKAQNSLTSAQNHVKKLDKDIKEMRKIVEKDQAKDRAKIDAAKSKLTTAQNHVNKLNRTIKDLKNKIKRTRNPWEKTKLYTSLKSVEASKLTATGVLKAAQLAMNGLKGLNVNPDLDVRVASLLTTKHGALITLESAKVTLEGLKFTLGVTGDVATYAIDKGTDAMINIRKANFEGKLNGLSGGFVNLNTDLEWLGNKKNVSFKFDFNDAANSVKNLVKQLM